MVDITMHPAPFGPAGMCAINGHNGAVIVFADLDGNLHGHVLPHEMCHA